MIPPHTKVVYTTQHTTIRNWHRLLLSFIWVVATANHGFSRAIDTTRGHNKVFSTPEFKCSTPVFIYQIYIICSNYS
jgi:hypothetical protein